MSTDNDDDPLAKLRKATENPLQKLVSDSTARTLERWAKELDTTSALRDLVSPSARAIEEVTRNERMMQQSLQRWSVALDSSFVDRINDENAKMRTMLQRIVDDSMPRVFADFDATSRALERMHESLIAPSTLDAVNKVTAQLADGPGAKLVRAMKLHSRQFEEMHLGTSAFMRAISESVAHTFDADAIRQSMTYKLMEDLQDRDLSFQESVEALTRAVEEHVPAGQSSPISFDGWLTIIVALFFFCLQDYLDEQSNQEWAFKLDAVESHLVAKFDNLKIDSIDNSFYFVATSRLNVRNEPTTNSAILRIIHPNQKVRQIEQQGHWLYVEYFDFIDEIPRTGWVYKRYLKKIELEVAD